MDSDIFYPDRRGSNLFEAVTMLLELCKAYQKGIKAVTVACSIPRDEVGYYNSVRKRDNLIISAIV